MGARAKLHAFLWISPGGFVKTASRVSAPHSHYENGSPIYLVQLWGLDALHCQNSTAEHIRQTARIANRGLSCHSGSGARGLQLQGMSRFGIHSQPDCFSAAS
ncbi:hypothetical protein N657DRAFT_647977 [Parathielavia appendiculata]|uniref:Uncharacterized protein n=1 Tax=Parathielavia appendiculata TaxID=2587402 RepID=A0AAN6TUZ2_9PEZI|nr:hypothetical protein N657DRAFT_647977 [Parathielavia appendiculata]